MSVASRISNATFRPIEIFTFAALIYVVIGFALSFLATKLEKRLDRGRGQSA
jgi:polar amino acid transport system permease protein